jgi:hypothetical protein
MVHNFLDNVEVVIKDKRMAKRAIPDATHYSINMAHVTATQTKIKSDICADQGLLTLDKARVPTPDPFDYEMQERMHRRDLAPRMLASDQNKDVVKCPHYGIDVDADDTVEPGVPIPDRHANVMMSRRRIIREMPVQLDKSMTRVVKKRTLVKGAMNSGRTGVPSPGLHHDGSVSSITISQPPSQVVGELTDRAVGVSFINVNNDHVYL